MSGKRFLRYQRSKFHACWGLLICILLLRDMSSWVLKETESSVWSVAVMFGMRSPLRAAATVEYVFSEGAIGNLGP